MKTAIMIIWMGLGSSETFDTESFPNKEVCELARTAMSYGIRSKWSEGDQYRFLNGSICIEIPSS